MANTQNFTVGFIIRTGRVSKGRAPIFARISIDGKRTEFSVKRSIPPELWNQEAGKVRPKSKEARDINPYLDKVSKRLLECYSEVLLSGKVITGQYIKNLFFGIEQEAVKTTDDLIEYHNTTCRDKLAPKTFLTIKPPRFTPKSLKTKWPMTCPISEAVWIIPGKMNPK